MNCRGCLGDHLDTVFVMEPVPIAGAFPLTAEQAINAERFPLEWRWCWDCGLVNVWPDVATDFADYSYRASDVPALRRHHRQFARWLRDLFPNTRLHVEIGGNDGVLTKHLPWPSINIDPSDAWVGPGYNEPFTSELARKLPKADLITSSNAFAHFDGIHDALAGVRHMLYGNGAFVMEVHDLKATLDTNQWDTIYHEHAVEWSEGSLRAVGALHGLKLEHVWRLPLHGGLLRALFRPDMPRKPHHVDRDVFGGLQKAYDEATAPPLPPGSIAYGAAARATVYLDHVRPPVDFVVDGSPRRAGRFVPGMGLPIRPPSDFSDPPAVLITARSHERDIKAKHPTYRGRWVTWE
jgi:methylation protein EvaC